MCIYEHAFIYMYSIQCKLDTDQAGATVGQIRSITSSLTSSREGFDCFKLI